jgi:subtilisin-like proprotein convertase family protein
MLGFVLKSYSWIVAPRQTCRLLVLMPLILLGAGKSGIALERDEAVHHGWTRSEIRSNGSPRSSIRPGMVFELLPSVARSVLARAPREHGLTRVSNGIEWELPMPDGGMKRFRIVETRVMAPALGERFPELRTYRGVGMDDARDRLRLDLQGGRIHAQMLSPDGHVYIDPLEDSDSTYLAYFTDTAPRSDADTIECLTSASEISSTTVSATSSSTQAGVMLRVYRLAVAVTGEYTQFHGGTVQSGLGAVVTAVNRINGIYESELGIRFMLVANNDLLVYTDPATDPYENTDAAAMLGQNQATLDAVIGPANYDVGHLLATAGGGIAQLDSVCVPGWKGRGVTGRANPAGDSYHIDYLAHELGHQFGARHTFNGVSGSCSANNRHSNTAYEPGSGSTIMSYSGLCDSDNVQINSDPYFHSANLVQIQNFVSGGCVTPVSSENLPPSVDAGTDHVVPVGTPFCLSATADDADGDLVSYCWEQLDLGAATALDGVDPGSGPLFRSFSPSSQPTRHFPSLEALLSNAESLWEVLPTTDRTLNFRVTARDHHPDGGGFGMDEAQITFTTSAGPFVILSQNSGAALSGLQTVVWDVAGTDLAPVSAAFVDILLSTNAGLNFPIMLAERVPNDGVESVVLPDIYASDARLLVRASDSIFFDINDASFSIVPSGDASLVLVSETHSFATNASVLVPASGTRGDASLFPLPIFVTGVSGLVERVTVELHGLTHTYLDDLDILLVNPMGHSVMLLSDSGGGARVSGAELLFSDAGTAIPTGGLLPSGEYHPVNVGSGGDSFPVAGPFGSALSALTEDDPNGTWALYIVDDSTGDTGTLSAGWSLSFETMRLESVTNQPPILVRPSTQYVHVGNPLIVTNHATDPDNSGDLVFALHPDAPAGAVLSMNGVLTWSPEQSFAGTTNACGLRVTDGGIPALSAEAELEIVVAGSPFINSFRLGEGEVYLEWTAIPAGHYQVECSQDLDGNTWTPVGEGVVSSGFLAGTTCVASASTRQFFRIRVIP